VEDDKPVRDLAVTILRSSGHTVLAAADATEALHVLAVHLEPIKLILTDVVLVGMGGRELASYADQIAPGVPVLFTSGHTDDLLIAHGVYENKVDFISKPYSASALRNKVREILSRQRGEGGGR
jgi:DNA-binding NtrC family response regulator